MNYKTTLKTITQITVVIAIVFSFSGLALAQTDNSSVDDSDQSKSGFDLIIEAQSSSSETDSAVSGFDAGQVAAEITGADEFIEKEDDGEGAQQPSSEQVSQDLSAGGSPSPASSVIDEIENNMSDEARERSRGFRQQSQKQTQAQRVLSDLQNEIRQNRKEKDTQTQQDDEVSTESIITSSEHGYRFTIPEHWKQTPQEDVFRLGFSIESITGSQFGEGVLSESYLLTPTKTPKTQAVPSAILIQVLSDHPFASKNEMDEFVNSPGFLEQYKGGFSDTAATESAESFRVSDVAFNKSKPSAQVKGRAVLRSTEVGYWHTMIAGKDSLASITMITPASLLYDSGSVTRSINDPNFLSTEIGYHADEYTKLVDSFEYYPEYTLATTTSGWSQVAGSSGAIFAITLLVMLGVILLLKTLLKWSDNPVTNSLMSALFAGRLARGHYFFAGLIISIGFGVMLSAFTASTESTTFLLIYMVGFALKLILDAKRLRDLKFSGQWAWLLLFVMMFGPVILFLLPITPALALNIAGAGSVLLFLIQLFLWFKKGDLEANKYGKSTYDLSLWNAVLNRTEASDADNN